MISGPERWDGPKWANVLDRFTAARLVSAKLHGGHLGESEIGE
jgi:hypothetical protein